jgi:hypothetical protein
MSVSSILIPIIVQYKRIVLRIRISKTLGFEIMQKLLTGINRVKVKV